MGTESKKGEAGPARGQNEAGGALLEARAAIGSHVRSWSGSMSIPASLAQGSTG